MMFTKNTLRPNICASCQFFQTSHRVIKMSGSTPFLEIKDTWGTCSLIDNGRYRTTPYNECRYRGRQSLYKRWIEMPPTL